MKQAFAFSAAALAALLASGAAMAAGPTAMSPSSGTSRDTTQGSGTQSTAPSTSNDSTSTGKSGRTTTAPPAEKPGALSLPHRLTGSVVSVDTKANTLSVRDKDGKEYTLTADSETAPDLSRLKAGDQVKVTYKRDKQQMVLTKITTTGERTSRTTK